MIIDIRSSRVDDRFRFAMLAASVAVGLAAWCVSGAASAQAATPAPGQLVPKSFATEPAAPNVPEAEKPSEAAPSIDADLPITVSRFEVEDEGVPLPAEARRVLTDLEGKPRSLAQVYAGLARVEQLCADDGHFLTRVVIPPQKFASGGVLRIHVVAGFVGKVDVSALPAPVRAKAGALLSPLIGKKPLARSEFESRLIRAGEVSGLSIAPVITTGDAPGSVDLVVHGTYRAVTGSVSVDNWLSSALGGSATSVALSANSLAGQGEQWYASGGLSTGNFDTGPSNPYRLLALGLLWPLGQDGWGLNAEYVWSATHPRTRPGALETTSDYRRFALRLSKWLRQTRTDSARIRLSVDSTDAHQDAPLFDVRLYDDRIRAVRLGLDGSLAPTDTTRLGASLDVSHGLRSWGSRGPAQQSSGTPLSQPLASDIFSKAEWRVQAQQQLPAGFALSLRARGQTTSGRPLLLSEKFSLGGENDLSAAASSSLSGDRGWQLRSELQYQLPGSLPTPPTQLYGFVARGEVTTLMPTAVQFDRAAATDIGLGVRSAGHLAGLQRLPLDFAFEVAREQAGTGLVPPQGLRVHGSMSLRF